MTSPVVIADDQPVVVAGVEAALNTHRFNVVARVNDTDTLIQTMAEADCEVLVADPFMPYGRHPDGVGLVRRIRDMRPDVGIVVMSRLGNLPSLRLMLDLGVSALFDKRASLRDMPTAVYAAHIGRTFLSPAVRRALRDMDYGNGLGGTSNPLTQRELDVLRAYAQGMSLIDISRLMERSIKTISRQKRTAMVKLGLKNDAQFYQYLANVRAGLVDDFMSAGYDDDPGVPTLLEEDDDDDEAYVATKRRGGAARKARASRKGRT
ncbi:MAG: response regulator [Luteibacter sp.]